MNSKLVTITVLVFIIAFSAFTTQFADPIAIRISNKYHSLVDSRELYIESIDVMEDVINKIELEGSDKEKENIIKYIESLDLIKHDKSLFTPDSFVDYLFRRFLLRDRNILKAIDSM